MNTDTESARLSFFSEICENLCSSVAKKFRESQAGLPALRSDSVYKHAALTALLASLAQR
jgi:hypothetical protein